jgi:hypothetical protein
MKVKVTSRKITSAIISDSSEHQCFLLYLELPLASTKGTSMLTAPKSSTFPLNMLTERVLFFFNAS